MPLSSSRVAVLEKRRIFSPFVLAQYFRWQDGRRLRALDSAMIRQKQLLVSQAYRVSFFFLDLPFWMAMGKSPSKVQRLCPLSLDIKQPLPPPRFEKHCPGHSSLPSGSWTRAGLRAYALCQTLHVYQRGGGGGAVLTLPQL